MNNETEPSSMNARLSKISEEMRDLDQLQRFYASDGQTENIPLVQEKIQTLQVEYDAIRGAIVATQEGRVH